MLRQRKVFMKKIFTKEFVSFVKYTIPFFCERTVTYILMICEGTLIILLH